MLAIISKITKKMLLLSKCLQNRVQMNITNVTNQYEML